jgi:diguanylate cyclase (GGDEF)-like protein
MVRVIGSQIGQFMARKQAEENLLYVATHDTLTGLPNRYMFNQRFAHALNNAQRYRKTMALLFLDLDRFKFINDTLGHPFGDRLLQEAAARLRMCLRESDTIARFGGDEFVALIEDFNEPGDVISVAQKILHALLAVHAQGETCRRPRASESACTPTTARTSRIF